MSKLSFITRKTNANGEVSINVRHTHAGSSIVKATGVVVHPSHFNGKTGRVVNLVNAPELNAVIAGVEQQLATAARNLRSKGIEETKEAMQAQLAEDATLTERLVRIAPKVERLQASLLDELYAELEALKAQVVQKQAEIIRYELSMGINTTHLVADYVNAYAQSKVRTRAKNTVTGYVYTAQVVGQFRPLWEMKDVTPETLKELVDYLIETGKGKSNLTINDVVTKLKTVVYDSAKKLSLDVSGIRTFRTDVTRKRNPNPVYLTKEELQDVIDVELTSLAENNVRDRFVVMALSGIRYSDTVLSKENFVNGELVLSTEKTDTDITIPLSPLVDGIMQRYDYTLPSYDLTSFNRTLKKLCARIPSLNHSITTKKYRGANKPQKTAAPKYKSMSAHVARKTFINLALSRGVSPVAIAGIVGHSGTDLIMKTYGSKEAGKNVIAGLMD